MPYQYIDVPPKIAEGAFPPSLQSAVDAACCDTEADRMAVAIHFVASFSAHIGASRHICISNRKHPLSFYGILVGATGTVKGTAEDQYRVIEKLACQYLSEKYGYIPPRRLTGLSSGEGLIQAIKDPVDDGDEEGVLDKRLLITESEYANILSQDQRNGNTLSTVLRDAYDGEPLATLTINSRVASNPRISIIGHITPKELSGHKSFSGQSRNGSLNRNLIIFAKRPDLNANPRRYTTAEMEALSQWLANAIYRGRDGAVQDNYLHNNADKEVLFSDEAISVIEKEYYIRESALDRMPELLASLVSRHRAIVRRLAALLALLDEHDVVQASHIKQAYRWIDYSLDSLRYLLEAIS